jgi:hypothetical protein
MKRAVLKSERFEVGVRRDSSRITIANVAEWNLRNSVGMHAPLTISRRLAEVGQLRDFEYGWGFENFSYAREACERAF